MLQLSGADSYIFVELVRGEWVMYGGVVRCDEGDISFRFDERILNA